MKAENNIAEEQNIRKPKELIFTRIINAPRELVFDVWTKQEHLEKWFGPDGFTTTTKEINIAEGGIWRFTMHGPDGKDYTNKIVFTEVKTPQRLAYYHTDDTAEEKVRFNAEVSFDDLNGKTLLKMRSIFDSEEMLEKVIKENGAFEGAIQHLARLKDYLQKL